MNERQIRTIKAIRGALAFFDKRSADGDRELSHLHRRLQTTVDAIDGVAADQVQAGGKLLASARRQLEQLREKHMQPLSRLARRIFAGEPRVVLALRVPHKRAPADEVLAAAEAMAKALQPHRRLLAASSIDPRRLTRLREETRMVRKLFVAANARTPQRTLATRRLPALLATARADVDAIDALLAANAPSLDLVRWRQMTRVGKRLGRPRLRRSQTSDIAGDVR